MMSSNVLHVIPAMAPRYGGPSVAVIGMCQALRNAGRLDAGRHDGRGRP